MDGAKQDANGGKVAGRPFEIEETLVGLLEILRRFGYKFSNDEAFLVLTVRSVRHVSTFSTVGGNPAVTSRRRRKLYICGM